MKLVFTTDASYYMQWQSELLEYSWQRCGSRGDLVRLVSIRDNDILPEHGCTEVICYPFSESGFDDSVPIVTNRLFLLDRWMQTQEQNTPFLFMDPDVVLRKPLEFETVEKPIGQHWIGMLNEQVDPWGMFRPFIERHSRVALQRVQPLTWPAIVKPRELGAIMPRWRELHLQISQEIYDAFGTHIPGGDMLGYTIAAAEAGLHHDLEMIAAFVKWPDDRIEGAPCIHYCQDVEQKKGSVVWSKKKFKPWHPSPRSDDLRFRYYQDLIDIIREYQRSHRERVLSSQASIVEGLHREETSEGVVLETGGERLCLNKTALFLLENLDGRSVKEFIADVEALYPAPANTIEDDIYRCVAELESKHVVKLDSPPLIEESV